MTSLHDRISQLPPKKLALLVESLRDRLDSFEKKRQEPIAVIGMSCRFPGGASSPREFWRLLHNGVDAISEIPRERWDTDALYDPDPSAAGKIASRYGGFLADVGQFDPFFFGISPREAESMDPQQRLLLEVVWEALEDAAQCPDKLAGSRTGVFVGVCNSDYSHLMLQRASETFDMYLATGGALSVTSGRLSYVLGLQGPAVSLDTACSSSLVALHLACRSIRSGESEMAIAAGVNLILSPNTTIALSRSGMMATDGRCKAFDASADGFIRSEGCGAVVLKRLSDAVANRDRVLAVIRGTAVNQDGRSSGLTAPNGPSQEAVIRAALADGGIEPVEVDYIETHGTGTPLGDPIEVRALANVFGSDRRDARPLNIGSVKTNLGHLESGAGIAGFIKAVLSLHHEEIPPSLHLHRPNPHIPWERFPIVVPVVPTPWVRGARRRVCGVSSFGISGTNAHAVLEEAPPQEQPASGPDRPAHVYTVSAKSAGALVETVKRHAQALAEDRPSLANACYTANTGRKHFPHRFACMSRTLDELRTQLESFAAGEPPPGAVSAIIRTSSPMEVVFLFPGQGGQYVGMAKELYRTESTFRQALNRCSEALNGCLERPLIELLFDSAEEDTRIHDPVYAQPANFAIEYAAAEMWKSWGVSPSAVVGHSLGEFAAACVAGMCSPEDGIRLVSTRGRLMQQLPPTGAMAAVHERQERVSEVIARLGGKAAIGAINHPEQTVLSGPRAAVEAIAGFFTAEGVEVEWLRAYHGYHSPEMSPMVEELVRAARGVKFQAPEVTFVSTLTGKPLPHGKVLEPEYWGRQVIEPVNFVPAVASLRDLGYRVFLDLGPAPVLGGMGRYCYPDGVWLATLRPGRKDWEQALETLASLHTSGVAIDWEAFDRPYTRRRTSLPTSVFERQRYWAVDSSPEQPMRVKAARTGGAIHPLLGVRVDHPILTFETCLDSLRASALPAHRIGETAVLAGPAYVEMAMAAAAEVLGPGPHVIEDLVIREALALDGADCVIQTIVTEDELGTAVFQACSRSRKGDSESWRKHATARARPELPAEWSSEELHNVRRRCTEPIRLDVLREQLRALGIEIPAMEAIDTAWKGEGEIVAQLSVPANQASHYWFDPSAADAALLSFTAMLPSSASEPGDGSFILAGIDRVIVRKQAVRELWSHATLRRENKSVAPAYVGDLDIYAETGEAVAAFHGLRFQRVAKSPLTAAQSAAIPNEDWFYRVEWEAKTSEEQSAANRRDCPRRSSVEIALDRLPAKSIALYKECRLDEYAEIAPKLNQACAAYIANAFLQLGWDPIPGDRTRAEDLAERLGIAPRHRRLFDRLLQILSEEGILARAGESWEVVRRPLHSEPDLLVAGLRHSHRRLTPQVNLVEKCGRHLADVLRATLDPLHLLFEAGSHAETEALYKDSPSAIALNTLVRDAVSALIAAGPANGRLRVLEIGAGTGGTSAFVLPVLPADRTDYVFTDLSTAFLDRAREKFAAYPFVRYQLLDIERAAEIQGFAAGSFDLVIASNVLHATSDIRRALANAQSLLAPGGTLVLVEVTGVERWVDLTFGLTEGWWKVSDHEWRTEGPTLSVAAWRRVLEERGFRAAILPVNGEQDAPPAAVIVAETLNDCVGVRGATDAGRPWILFSGQDETGLASTESLRRRAIPCATITRGDQYAHSNDCFTINPRRSEDFARAIGKATQGSPSEIVFLWGLDGVGCPDGESPTDAAALCASLAYIVKGITAANPGCRLWVVTRGAQAAGETDLPLACEQATLWGLGRTIALEEPEIWGGLLDLDPRDKPEEQADWLVANAICADGEDQIAVRNGVRLAARLARVPSLHGGTLPIDPKGSYLITGGLGALGVKIARWLVDRGARRLVLTSRHGLPDRATWPEVDPGSESARCVAVVSALEALGAQVEIVAADVSDSGRMGELFGQFGREWPPLRGIVHAAVAPPNECRVRDLEEDALRGMLAAKVAGSRNLLRLGRSQPLDFVVLFSSMAALLGLNGGGHYAAACQYLDAAANDRRPGGVPVISINWGGWDEMRSPTGEIRRTSRVGPVKGSIHPMASPEALDAMGTALASKLAHVAIAAIDWETFGTLHESRRPRPFTSRFRAPSNKTAPRQSKGEAEDLRVRLSTATRGEQQSVLVEAVRAAVARNLGIRDPESIDPDKRLFEMGLDSLMAIDLKTRLELALGEALPTTLTFNYPTIAALSEYLGQRVLKQPAQTNPVVRPRPAVESDGHSVQKRTNDMSEDELAELLRQKLVQLS